MLLQASQQLWSSKASPCSANPLQKRVGRGLGCSSQCQTPAGASTSLGSGPAVLRCTAQGEEKAAKQLGEVKMLIQDPSATWFLL